MHPLVEKVRDYCRKHQLFEPGPVVVGVSGGADSLTLLHVLITLKGEFDIQPHVATLDHGIRGAESAEDVAFVRNIAEAWKVDVTAWKLDIPAIARERRDGIEETARMIRYGLFSEIALSIGAKTIAVGHNQNDQAETVLMHIVRGAGLGGLGGMLPKTVRKRRTIVRPLLDIQRHEIDTYLAEHGITPRFDETNRDTDYTRNKLRHRILPLLREINPQAESALARLAEITTDDYRFLEKGLPSLQWSPGVISIDRAEFLRLERSQQRLLLHKAIYYDVGFNRRKPVDVGFERIEAVIGFINRHMSGFRTDLGSNLRLQIQNGAIQIIDSVFLTEVEVPYPLNCPSLPAGEKIKIAGEGIIELPGSDWRLQISKNVSQPEAWPLVAAIWADKDATFELRTRRPGDRFKPAGLGGHSQKLSDTMINMKIVAEWRDHLPLLTVNAEIAFMVVPSDPHPQIRIAEPFCPQQQGKAANWEFKFFSV